MVNKKVMLLREEKSLDALLTEGNRYLAVMQRVYDCYESDSKLCKTLLFVMDRYSRYKILVKEATEEVNEILRVMEEMASGDQVWREVRREQLREEEIEEQMEEEMEEEIEDDIEEADLELINLEDDFVELDEEEIIIEEQIRYFNTVIYLKSFLASLEKIFVQLINVDAKLMCRQWSVYLGIKTSLKNYCERAKEVLERNVNFMKSLKNFKKRHLAKRAENKCWKLQQLVMNLIERQKLFDDIEGKTSETNKEKRSH